MFPIETEVIIVGAGISGLSTSYYLSRKNINHLIFEKSSAVGGIWNTQRWPGIRCDTDIIKYSFGFRPLFCPTSMVSGEVISEYLSETSKILDIESKVIFNTMVNKAVFDTQGNLWHVYTDKGCCKSRFLINANGYFADAPYIPEIQGAENFKGIITHLANLDSHADLDDKRIVLVGSGASAISAAPALCSMSKSMTLLQRSPSYIFEDDNQLGYFVKLSMRLHKIGLTQPTKLVNYLIQLKDDLIFVAFRHFPWVGKQFFKYHWIRAVGQKMYEEHFRPSYNPWEQRIPVSIGLKEIIKNRKLEIVTGQIHSFTETGIVLSDGRILGADMCILATGYNLQFFKFGVFIDNQQVDTKGINYYRGMMMGGLPNYFQPFGTQHTSFTRRIEVISKLIVKIISYMKRRQIDTVSIERRKVEKSPRITPNYIMRELGNLPIIYGSMELPSIDNFIFSFFLKRNYLFSKSKMRSDRSSIFRNHRPSRSSRLF
ncbi:MAG TPA: NAD(P)/FAD-dependent oxidoreductase [Gallionella sp.]|nr:NAD(P)/FAD-dependent oxidoreductase [Gallionella sp.]